MALWKIHCEENKFPGVWRHWYRQQCVAIGWPPGDGYFLQGTSSGGTGWNIARRAVQRMAVGDSIIVSFNAHRVGRIGTITGFRVADSDWNPLVPKRSGLKHGDLGRRIEVRWDLACGLSDQDTLIELPPPLRFSGATLRLTLAVVTSPDESRLRRAMENPGNWVRLQPGFKYERSLSEYVSAFPHRLEDGLVPHPDAKVREKVFSDRTRLDVLLMDRENRPVVVECKQGAPTVANVKQLCHYLDRLSAETDCFDVRGLLVHGGSRRVSREVASAVRRDKRVQLVFHELSVRFDPTVNAG